MLVDFRLHDKTSHTGSLLVIWCNLRGRQQQLVIGQKIKKYYYKQNLHILKRDDENHVNHEYNKRYSKGAKFQVNITNVCILLFNQYNTF